MTTKHFKDAGGEFGFDYNPLFTATQGSPIPTQFWYSNSKGQGVILAHVNVSKDYEPKTNFAGAYFTISRSVDALAFQSCLEPTNGEKNEGEAKVSGFLFTKFISTDAGAGNFYDTTSYRGMMNGYCYAIEYTMHSTNIANYPADLEIKEFNKSKIQDQLENIVKSFKSLVSSN